MSATEAIPLDFYSDLACPFAYLTRYRLRTLLPEYGGRLILRHRSLALEYVNRQPTPKPLLDVELPVLMLAEPAIPYAPWHAPASEWPVTFWPAFEAVTCAERQGWPLAAELDWAIRVAFFADSRCVSMRHVLFDLAERSGLDMTRFAADFDGGVAKRQVLAEAQAGWGDLHVAGSPTLVLPSGEQRSGAALGLPSLAIDEGQHHRLVAWTPARCAGDGCRDLLRRVLDEALDR